MIKFESTIEINQPLQTVFAFITHFENIPLWNYYVREVRQIDGGQAEIGRVYHQVRKDDQQDYQIVEFEPNRKVVVKTLPGSKPAFERTITFEATPSGTRLIDGWELETGYNPLIERLGAGRVKASVAENLMKLKELLETKQTRLQDDRVIKL